MINKQLATLVFLTLSTQVTAITLDEYTKKLLQEHPFYSKLTLSEKANQLSHQSSHLAYDWTTELSANGSHASSNSINSEKIEVGAQKIIKTTGGRLNLKHSWNDTNQSQDTSLTTISYTQPLLKNRAGINTNLATDMADIDLEIRQLNLLEQSENFLATKIKSFIELALAQHKVTAYKNDANLSAMQLDIAKEKYAQSILSESSMLQEKDGFIRDQQKLLQAEQALQSAKKELATWVALDPKEFFSEYDLHQALPTIATELSTIVATNRATQQLKLEEDKLKRRLVSNENKLKPSLDLSVNLTSQGTSNDYLSSLSNQSASYQVGFAFTYPLTNAEENLQLAQTMNAIAQQKITINENALNLNLQIDSVISRIELQQELVDIAYQQLQLSDAKLLESEEQFSKAMLQKSNVISAKRNANLARFSHAQAAASLQKTIIDYLSLTDQLLN